jgi:MFS family permease
VYHTGGALGAAMGGWMAEALGWRWEFGVQMPYLLLLPIGGYLCIPAGIGQAHGHASKTLAQAMEGFDYAGCLTISVSVTTLVVFAVRSAVVVITINVS